MASQQTPNYRLSRWKGTDRILMEEFNSDNEKIDTALKANADAITAESAALQAALAGVGNCFMEWGTYTGSGETTKALTFSRKPVAVVIYDKSNSYTSYCMLLVRGIESANGFGSNNSSRVSLTWTDTGVSYYGSNANYAYNTAGKTYVYAAFLLVA